jgi:hypothetical protein
MVTSQRAQLAPNTNWPPDDTEESILGVDRDRGSYSTAQDGPPALVIEVASESTFRADLDLERGKAWTYQQAGVREYLVLDPTAEWVPGRGRGWRLEGAAYVPWPPEEGRWRSRELGVSFGVEDGLVAVYRADGRRQLREGEVSAFRAYMEQEIAQRDRDLAERDRDLALLQAELNRRDHQLSRLRRLVARLRRRPPPEP